MSDPGIELVNGRFFCMDSKNVNSGGKSRMKRLLQHAVPLAGWIGCGNRKVVLFFKHPLQVYPEVLAPAATLLALWNFFHYQHLAPTFVKNAAETYDERQVTLICPSVTRWMGHDRASKNLCNGLKQIVSALATCVKKRKQPDVLAYLWRLHPQSFLLPS